MRTPRVAPSARVVPRHHHPAIARWVAELRRQQRRGRTSLERVVQPLSAPDLAVQRQPPS